MIVKIQRPLGSSEDNPPALAYDRSRTFQTFLPMSPELAELMGDAEKIYADVDIKDGQLFLRRVVKPQAW